MSDLDARLAGLTPEKRALLQRALAAKKTAEGPPGLEPIEARRPEDPSPLSFAQQGLWFLDQWEPGSFAYNAAMAVRIHGPLSVDHLNEAMRALTERHEALRTVYPSGADGLPEQELLDTWTAAVKVVAGTETGLDAILRAEAQAPFDLTADLMWRLVVIEVGPLDHVLMVGGHHIGLDNWSGAVLLRELGAAYDAIAAGRTPDLPTLTLQYDDYAAWQRRRLSGPALDALIGYWTDHLRGAPTVLDLPLDHPRPAVQRFEGARYPVRIGPDAAEALQAACRELAVTPYMYLLTVFAALLYRWTGQSDLVIGTPVANRTRVELEPIVGFFNNTMVVRCRLHGNPTFAEALARVKEAVVGGFAHQELPFELLVDAVKPPRDPSRNPLFQVNFRVAPPSAPILTMAGLQVERYPFDLGYSKFDLAQELHLDPNGIGGHFEYHRDLFEASTMEELHRSFEAMLRAVLTDPATSLLALPTVAAAEPRRGPSRIAGRRAAGAEPVTS